MASPTSKTCFVTIGATASFSSLIKAVVAPDFLQALEAHGFTELLVQYGEGGEELFNACLSNAMDTGREAGLEVTGFALDKAGLQQHMLRARGENMSVRDGDKAGVVISHAGSGTILDALRLSVPLIVVPNEELLDNHQVELAEVLAEQQYVVYGKLDNLIQALGEAQTLASRQWAWPPPNSGKHRKVKGGLKGVIDDEMGWVD